MPLNKIKGDELEKKLRKEFYDITWISVSVEGTTLKVCIKENDSYNPTNENSGQSDIVAEKSGEIESILVREGTKLVSVGEFVEKGTILIEGVSLIPIEDGTEIKEVPVAAKGDVAVIYEIPIEEKVLLEYENKVYSGKELKKYQHIKIPSSVCNLPVYLENNKNKIDYATYESNGWFIGSGAIESSNKTIVQLRTKQAGMRWSVDGANWIIILRCYDESKNWNEIEKILVEHFMGN